MHECPGWSGRRGNRWLWKISTLQVIISYDVVILSIDTSDILQVLDFGSSIQLSFET